jgi:hypothetical protein
MNLEFASIVSGSRLVAMVEITVRVGDVTLKEVMPLDKAREIRGLLDGVIEAAISDELLVRFLTTNVGLSIELATAALRDFRVMRQGSAEVVYPT